MKIGKVLSIVISGFGFGAMAGAGGAMDVGMEELQVALCAVIGLVIMAAGIFMYLYLIYIEKVRKTKRGKNYREILYRKECPYERESSGHSNKKTSKL